jgi:hypothetical protein
VPRSADAIPAFSAGGGPLAALISKDSLHRRLGTGLERKTITQR